VFFYSKLFYFSERCFLLSIEFNLFSGLAKKNSNWVFRCLIFVFFIFMLSGVNAGAEPAIGQSAEDALDADAPLSAEAEESADSGNWDNWDEGKQVTIEKQDGAGSQLSAVPVVDSAGIDKAMEEALRETMIVQAKSYYPMISSMSLESRDSSVLFEITYDAASEKDLISIKHEVNKEQMTAQIQILSPLLQKTEDLSMGGDLHLVESIQLAVNAGLTSTLGLDAKIAFIQRISMKLIRPVQFNVKQYPGLIRIELRPYQAGPDEDKPELTETERDILFQPSEPPPLLTTSQVFGQSFQQERDYENEVNFGGERTLIDQLESRPGIISRYSYTDYSRGASSDAVKQDMEYRYPAFGSLDYWKKHLSGVFVNTTKLLKQRRGQHVFMNTEPSFAVIYDRKGPAHIRLGYNFQREFPFFYQKLGRLAPADGAIRHDIRGGIVYTTQSPWTFSFQNRLGIFSSENLSESSKFGDRLTQYRYEAGQAVRYNLKRGFLQLGGGVKLETQEVAIRERSIEGYLSLLGFRQLSKKWAARAEYNYEHKFFPEGTVVVDMNVHRLRTGLEYKPSKNSLLKPSLGLAFYDGEAFYGLIGGMQYSHQLSRRDKIQLSYNTDFIRDEVSSFGRASLNNRRLSTEQTGRMIRYHIVRAAYQRKLSKKLNFILEGSYRKEDQLEVELKDKHGEYRFSAALRRSAPKKWVIELRYILSYLDAYRISTNAAGVTNKLDQGNTNHQAYIRLYRYFGDA